jgi:hypothetical protein
MVRIAQLVEHRIVDPGVAGSIPVSHPILKLAPVAQLDRASDFESVRRGFESLQACHIYIYKTLGTFKVGRGNMPVACFQDSKERTESKMRELASLQRA